jgi:hypothetical protein
MTNSLKTLIISSMTDTARPAIITGSGLLRGEKMMTALRRKSKSAVVNHTL